MLFEINRIACLMDFGEGQLKDPSLLRCKSLVYLGHFVGTQPAQKHLFLSRLIEILFLLLGQNAVPVPPS